MTLDTPTRSRAGGRAARRALRTATDFIMLAGVHNRLPTCEVLTGSQVERIDAASMDILENVGVIFRDDIALADWKAAGAKVVGERVYLDRGLVRDLIATIPASFTYHARDPQKNVALGGRDAIFVPMTGAPYLRDLDDRRRNPTLDDLAMFHKLSHMLPALHSSAHHIVEPYDHPISQRHLRITYSSMKHSDKTFMGMTTSPKNAEDVIEMCRILFGAEFIESHPVVTGNCNGNSPLVWDETMLGAMRAFSRANQPVLCSPFVLGGGEHARLRCRLRRATQCRGAFGTGLQSSDPSRGTGDLRALPLHRVDEIRCADGGHAGNLPDELHDRPDGAVLRRALAHLEHSGRCQDL